MESYRDGEHQNVYRISSSILLWGVLGVKNDKKHQKIMKNCFLLYFSSSISQPLSTPLGVPVGDLRDTGDTGAKILTGAPNGG